MRLVTRGDLDGLTSAVIITSSEPIEEVVLIHPQDITDKKFEVTSRDILANLPYHPKCGKWFDHHLLTQSNERPPEKFDGRYGLAPSAARVVFEYYVEKNPKISRYETLLLETDRLDSAQLNIDDVIDPQNYILVGYTLDPRTGLGAYQEYFMKLLAWLKEKPIGAILKEPEVAQRVAHLREQDRRFREETMAHSRRDANVVITDFRGMSPLPITPSVRMPEPPPPSRPIFPIRSTPTASATSHSPDATCSHASRNAEEPVAQALATFNTGMPVCPISWRMRWPTMALAWNRHPAAMNCTSRMPSPASSSASSAASPPSSGTSLSA